MTGDERKENTIRYPAARDEALKALNDAYSGIVCKDCQRVIDETRLNGQVARALRDTGQGEN